MAESFVWDLIAKEDLKLGNGTFGPVTLPDGTTATLNKIGINTFLGDAVLSATAFDGADASEKINAAIAVLPSTGGVVDARGLSGAQAFGTEIYITTANVVLLLGAGTYTMMKRIWVAADNVSIVGQGRGRTILKNNANIAYVDCDPILASTRHDPVLFVAPTTKVDGLLVRDLTVDGNYSGLSNRPFLNDVHGNGFNLVRCANSRITNCEIKNIVFQAICWLGSLEGDTSGNVSDHNWVHDFGEYGISLAGIENNSAVTHNIVTSGLTLPETVNGAIGIWAASLQVDAAGGYNNDDNQILSNIVFNMPNDGIQANDGVRRLIIANNTVNTATRCISVISTVDDARVARDVKISGNNCYNATSSSNGAILVGGQTTNLLLGISICDNSVESAVGAGYHVTSCTRPRIVGNTCRIAGTGAGTRTEALFAAALVSPLIANNRFTGAAGAGIYLFNAACTDSLVVTNHLDGNGSAITDSGTRTIDSWNKKNATDDVQTSNASVSLSKQLTLAVGTGTAPMAVTSTTPVSNLAAGPILYRKDGTQQTNAHCVWDQEIVGAGGTVGVTMSNAAAFTNSGSYVVTLLDTAAVAAARVVYVSGTQFTITGTPTDTVRWMAVGN